MATSGDAIAVQGVTAQNVWIDHVEAFSDMKSGKVYLARPIFSMRLLIYSLEKDYYDGLIDITHGVRYVTVSWSFLHDHYKASLVGHSDNNVSVSHWCH